MKLNVAERLIALGLLPNEGSYATLRIVNDLKGTLGLTEGEFKEYEVKVAKDNLVQWNAKGSEPKDIEIGEVAQGIIADALKKLDKDEKLTGQHVSLYAKFVAEDLE